MECALFKPLNLRGVTLPNRIVVAPMCMYSSTDGLANDWHLMHYGQFLIGGNGLVFTEATGVEPRGRISPYCLGLWDDATESALKPVLAFKRRWGNAPFGIQLGHAGRKASVGGGGAASVPLPLDKGGWPVVGPSGTPFDMGYQVPEALDNDGLRAITASFVNAARRADRLGFDVVEVHAAHGYLLHQFLSPISNQRTDAYGGGIENRLRYPLEVFQAVREAFSSDKPVGVRVSATDWVDNGLTVEDTVVFAHALKEAGCDFIHVSSGANVPNAPIPVGPGYQVEIAARIKAATGMPTIAVGMIVDPIQAETIVRTGQADMVALARTMLYDPRWAWRAAVALGQEANYPNQYMRAHPRALGIPVPGAARVAPTPR